jgi:hypothetical protein
MYVCPDRIVEERRAHEKLLDLLKEKRTAEPDRTHFIRNNKVLSLDSSSKGSAQSTKS